MGSSAIREAMVGGKEMFQKVGTMVKLAPTGP